MEAANSTLLLHYSFSVKSMVMPFEAGTCGPPPSASLFQFDTHRGATERQNWRFRQTALWHISRRRSAGICGVVVMVMRRRRKGCWEPLRTGKSAQIATAVVAFCAIIGFSLGARPETANRAVVRVGFDRIPEERVVDFGHEMPRITLVSPISSDVPGSDFHLSDAGLEASEITRPAPGPLVTSRPRTPAPSVNQADVRPDANGILPIDFSLPKGVSSETGGIGVAKTLASEGGTATGLTIFLIGGSVIEVDRNELVLALDQLGASEKAGRLPQAGASGRLSLDKVRTAGLDLRYDAIHDRLVLRP